MPALAGLRCLITALLMVVATSTVGARAETRTFEPASDWSILEFEKVCALERRFINDGDTITLQYRASGLNITLDTIVVSQSLRTRGNRGRISYLPDETPRPPSLITAGRIGELNVVRFRESLRSSGDDPLQFHGAARFSQEAEIEALLLSDIFADDVVQSTGEMFEPMAALRECAGSLLVKWGLEESSLQSNSNERGTTRLNFSDWAQQIMKRNPARGPHESAQVDIVVIIDTAGRVANCIIINDPPRDEFGEAACEGMREFARYLPAKDAQGRPVTGSDILTLLFSGT